MTANEMSYRFDILYNKITKFDAPGYKDREKSELFNISQSEIIKSYYNPKGNKYKEGYENSEKRRKDLANLVRNVYLTATNLSVSQTDCHKFGYMYDLPTDMLWAVQEECDMDRYILDCSTVSYAVDPKSGFPILTGMDFNSILTIKIKPVTHDEYNLNIENPFKRPYEKLIWRLDFYNIAGQTPEMRHELINMSGFLILRYRIRYIRKPTNIVVDNTTPVNQVNCELISSLHDEIVIRAVELATGITMPEEYKIKNVEEMKSE